MAATTDKASPSNRPIDGQDEATSKEGGSGTVDIPVAGTEKAEVVSPPSDTPASDPHAVESPSDDVVNAAPTYLSVESSPEYLAAKRLLNEGRFEEALETITEGLQGTTELLRELSTDENEDFSLHESLAPLHYLYGTTLLYSIEENDSEVTTAGSAVSTAVVEGGEAVAAASKPTEQDSAEGEGEDNNGAVTASSAADDLEIAFENLEAARVIINKMPPSDKLMLALAQIHLRCGDLMSINNRRESAIEEYKACLRIRKKSPFLERFDRKLADVHNQLGVCYINLASKDEEPNDDGGSKDNDDAAKEARRAQFRNKAVFHLLEVCKCFCGEIATLCEADPSSVIENIPEGPEDSAEGRRKAKLKSTGEEEEHDMEIPSVASFKMKTIRKRAEDLFKATTDLSEDTTATILDRIDVMEDVQEAADEANSAIEGVHKITDMKEQAIALAEGKASTSVGDSTTTIGFGGGVSQGVAVAAAPAAESTQPMMVVKKKKRAAVESVEGADTKKPKSESN